MMSDNARMLNLKKNWPYILFSGIFLLTGLFYLQFVHVRPIFDGEVYLRAVVDLMRQDWDLMDLNIFNHPSMAYIVLFAPIRLVKTQVVEAVNLINIALALMGGIFFYLLVRALFFRRGHQVEHALLTLLLCLNPLFVACIFNFNLDFPVTIFSVIALCAMVRRQRLLFLLAGIFLVFSKETGILIYLLLAFSFGIMRVIEAARIPQPASGGRLRTWLCMQVSSPKLWLRQLWNVVFYLCPIFLLELYVYYRTRAGSGQVFWEGNGLTGSGSVFVFNIFAELPAKVTRLVQFFILNSSWILTLSILIGAGAFVLRTLRRRRTGRILAGRSDLWAIGLVFLGYVYVLTSFVTFSNPRYVLPALPLLILLFYRALLELIRSSQVRVIVIFVIAVFAVVQVYRTVDPVSMQLLGTVQVGEHEMLAMNSFTHEFAGLAGRDQIIYNLEYRYLGELADRIADFAYHQDATVVFNADAESYLFVSDTAPERAYIQYLPLVADSIPTKRILYINFPFIAPMEAELPTVGQFFDIGSEVVFERDGYALPAYELLRR